MRNDIHLVIIQNNQLLQKHQNTDSLSQFDISDRAGEGPKIDYNILKRPVTKAREFNFSHRGCLMVIIIPQTASDLLLYIIR